MGIDTPYNEPLISITLGHDIALFNDTASYQDTPIGIFLHGFGAQAEDIASISKSLLECVPHWIIPQAPIPLIKFLSYKGFAWFPTSAKDIQRALLGNFWVSMPLFDSVEIEQATKQVIDAFIRPIVKHNPNRPIIIAGFSQGGMMATNIVLSCLSQGIAINKLLLCSSCLIAESRWNTVAKTISKTIAKNIEKNIRETKKSPIAFPHIFQSHGTLDPILLINQGKALRSFWEQYSTVDFHSFVGAHEIPNKIIESIQTFLST